MAEPLIFGAVYAALVAPPWLFGTHGAPAVARRLARRRRMHNENGPDLQR